MSPNTEIVILREKKRFPDGRWKPYTSGLIMERRRVAMRDGELVKILSWEAKYRFNGEMWRNESQDKELLRKWLKDMDIDNKKIIMGTNLKSRYDLLRNEIRVCLLNTNKMLVNPIGGEFHDLDKDGDHVLLDLVGVCNGVVTYAVTEGGEKKEYEVSVDSTFDRDVFETIALESLAAFCDALTKEK